jgi:DNA primase
MQLYHLHDVFKCFRCGLKGSIFKWVMAEDGLSYGQAVRKLAAMAGVSLTPDQDRINVLSKAMDYYRDTLELHQPAQDWLLARGIEKRMWFQANIGYAVGVPEGIPLDELASERLVYEGSWNPYMNERIIFGFHTHKGEIVHMQGRNLTGEEPKYLTLPMTTDTGTYPITDFLYGEEFLRDIREDAFLLEGPPDTLIVRQYELAAFGITGNDRFSHHAYKLTRAKRLWSILDNDMASRSKALPKLLEMQARMPDTEVYDVILPKPPGQQKQDVNSWYLDNGRPSASVFTEMVRDCGRPVIQSAIDTWGQDDDRHELLVDLINTQRRPDKWLRYLSKVSGEPLICLNYLARIRNVNLVNHST